MKINDTSRIGGVNPYRKSVGNAAAASEVKKGKKDEVQISNEAKEMASSVRNPEKLEQLKQAVATGTYHVDGQKVAEKLWPFLK
ncbi:MAG: anti-sigma-28 factor, FlgM family [Paenibacillaceae bacterium]|jgi:negative regulator of flagellin synthesis FlgM|nr:anti-sigma-28 factor, FlgM family [Paenibacillaceae bacterium]